jgi:hypothetical protein
MVNETYIKHPFITPPRQNCQSRVDALIAAGLGGICWSLGLDEPTGLSKEGNHGFT